MVTRDAPIVIVVTAPTGNIGSQILANLLERNAPVRAIVRDANRLPAGVRDRVEVIEGSHADADVVDRAFAGAETVFWLVPADPRSATVTQAYVGFTKPAAAALKRHRVKRVVDISALGRGSAVADRAGFVTASLAMDDLIASTGVAFRAVTCPSFMDNIARQEASIRERGVFSSPLDGDRQMPACATRDIASTATRLLLDPDWEETGHVAVLGPEDLSFNDMSSIMAQVLNKPVRYEQISFEAYRASFIQRGVSEAMAQGLTDMAWAKNEGLDNAERRTPENTTPTRFRQWCEEKFGG